MSFILDALKKSESERQRQTGPALFEVKVAPPRARFPIWAVLVGALLGINLLVLIWVLLRNDKPTPKLETAASVSNTSASVSVDSLPRSSASQQAETAAGAAAAYAKSSRFAPPTSEIQEPFTPNPLDSRPAVMPGTPEATAAARTRSEARRSAEELAARVRQQVEETASATDRLPNAIPTLNASGLPTRDELVNSGRAKIPELKISLHAYDPNPAKRFIFINGQRAREGDSLVSGVLLEAITRDGAIMSVAGQRFALPVQ